MEQTTGWLEGGMDRSFYRLHYNEIGPVRKQSGLDGKLDKKDGSDRSHNFKGDGTRTWPIGLRSERLDMGEALLGAIICLVCSSEDKERPLEDTGNVTYNFFWFLAKRTRDGGSLQEPTPIRTDNEADLVFFTDAKATEQGAWIGGFLQSKEGSIISWFSEEVQESWAPWLFVRKDPKRVIAALELLATLVAVRLWANGLQRGGKGRCWVRAGTDNQGNSYAVSRLMSTKYPLTVLIMELSETLRARNCELDLQWIPREKNQLADDLTNQVFTKFPMDCRVQFVGGDTKWLVLSELMEKANEFHMELAAEKKRKVAEPVKTRKAKKQKLLEPW